MDKIVDKPWYQRSAFWQALVTALTLFALLFPDWSPKIKAAVVLLQQIATFLGVDTFTRSVNPADLPAGTVFTERDGTTPAPKKFF